MWRHIQISYKLRNLREVHHLSLHPILWNNIYVQHRCERQKHEEGVALTYEEDVPSCTTQEILDSPNDLAFLIATRKDICS